MARFPLARPTLCMMLLLVLWSSQLVAQPVLTTPPPTGQTGTPPIVTETSVATLRAVVVGISEYRDQGIRPLNYAHKDAQAFADYLRSDAAGKLPKQIRTLTNKEATLAAVDDALNWLKKETKEGDVAILYFAGHGDVEVAALWQLGYLLTYDSPPNNFRNNAVRVEDLDLLAIELSSVRNARTMFFLDACRSGTLAEGRDVPHEHLAKQKANEVRILSCKSEQLSLEGPEWGGGRGVFSWHLIRGLEGLANDPDNDADAQIVTIEELEDYLKQTVVKETKQLVPSQRQDPVVVAGSETFPLSMVVPEIVASLQQAEGDDQVVALSDRSVSNRGSDDNGTFLFMEEREDAVDLLFNQIRESDLESHIDLAAIRALPAKEIPEAFIKAMAQAGREIGLPEYMQEKLDDFWTQVGIQPTDSVAMQALTIRMAIALHDRGQEVINSYLRSDPDDLEERTYTRLETSKYRWYPEIFRIVLKLLPEDHPLHDRLAVKEAYFSGASRRILAIGLEDRTQAYQDALALQLKALALDDKAPYVHNELGILYRQLRQYDKCEEHLRKAQELAPSWGLPFANLAAVLTGLDRLDEAQVLIDKALILLPEYSNAHLTQGMIHEKQGRFLHAEAEYLRCTQLAPNHFAGFELLGYLYQKTAEFVMANENFVIADYLKNNLPLTPTDTDMDGIFDLLDLNNFQDGFRSEEELLALIEQDPDNPDLYYELGQVYSADRRYALAVPRFRKTAELDANYPMVYDHLAWAYFRLDQPELADQSIRLAKEKEDALEGREMFLAMIAESWERWEEAESIYHELLVQDSSEMILYQKLGALYERSGRFPEAEETYLRLKETNAYSSLDILYQFYLRMMDRMPGQAAWIIRPANLLYQVCLNSEKNYVIREDRFEDTFDDPDPSEKLDMVTDYYYSWSTHKEVNKHPDLRYWPQVCERPLSLLDLAFPYLVLARERGDARQKQGDIYLHLEDRDQAEARFEQALSYVPTEEGLRDKIVGSYLARHQLPAARRHLAHQDSVGHLRFPDHLLLARMNTLDNRFVSATAVLDEASGFFLDRNQQIRLDDLRAQRALLAGDLEAALRQYEANHQAWPRTGEDAYAIARIYAKNRNENQAFRWLDKALDQGFGQYTWVLARDPWMDGLRQSPKWQEAVKL